MSTDCWLIDSEVLSLVPTTVSFDKHLSLMDTCHVVGTVHLRKYRPPLRFQTAASRCDHYQCLFACWVGPVVPSTILGHIKQLWVQDDCYPQRAVTGTVRICGYICALSPYQISQTGYQWLSLLCGKVEALFALDSTNIDFIGSDLIWTIV